MTDSSLNQTSAAHSRSLRCASARWRAANHGQKCAAGNVLAQYVFRWDRRAPSAERRSCPLPARLRQSQELCSARSPMCHFFFCRQGQLRQLRDGLNRHRRAASSADASPPPPPSKRPIAALPAARHRQNPVRSVIRSGCVAHLREGNHVRAGNPRQAAASPAGQARKRIPPCGGVPYWNASIMKPKRAAGGLLGEAQGTEHQRLHVRWRWISDRAAAQLNAVQHHVICL